MGFNSGFKGLISNISPAFRLCIALGEWHFLY